MPFTINIPTGRSADASGSRGPVINLPIRLGGSSGTVSSSGDKTSQQALAAAVAGAVDNPSDAADLAKMARKSPGKLSRKAPDKPTVKRLRDAVKAAQEDNSLGYDQTEEIRTVAASVGVDPRLAAAAIETIEEINAAGGDGGLAARRWAAALLDPAVLDKVARAANRADALDETTTTPAEIAELSANLQALQNKFTTLRGEFDTFKPAVAAEIDSINQKSALDEVAIAKNETDVLKVTQQAAALRTDVDNLKGAKAGRATP
jgi:hypothetical protein